MTHQHCWCFLFPFSATLLSGWIPTITNVTNTSFAVQWPLLTNQINQTVSAYMVFANWTTVYGGQKVTDRIVSSNATLTTIRRIPSYRNYQVIVCAVDISGRSFNSSAIYVRTLEGGKICTAVYKFHAMVA